MGTAEIKVEKFESRIPQEKDTAEAKVLFLTHYLASVTVPSQTSSPRTVIM